MSVIFFDIAQNLLQLLLFIANELLWKCARQNRENVLWDLEMDQKWHVPLYKKRSLTIFSSELKSWLNFILKLVEFIFEFNEIQMFYFKVLKSRLVCVKSIENLLSTVLEWFVYVNSEFDGVIVVKVQFCYKLRNLYFTFVNAIWCFLVYCGDLILHIVDLKIKS